MDVAVKALGTLSNQDLAVAIIAPDGRLLFENPRFSEAFGAEAWTMKFRDCLRPIAAPVGFGACQYVRGDGRIFSIATVSIPDGLLVIADDDFARLDVRKRAADAERIDLLTSLESGSMFRERLNEILVRFDARDGAVAVLTVDLGRLKLINNSLGASVGDALLGVVADRVRSVIAPADIAARSGNEISVLQIGQPQPQAAGVLAERLMDLLSRSYLVEGHLLDIEAHVGVVLLRDDGADCDQVLRRAGLAVERAKQTGRSAYRFFEPAMDHYIQARRSLELDLRRALTLREFALVYQPQWNVGSNRIIGFEALLRWHNPKRGLVSPVDFIPLAEEIGVIVPIGEWVLRTACLEAAAWTQPLSIAVNVSAAQFKNSELASAILSALRESGLDPNRLELEITESVLMGDHEAALQVLHEVQEIGVRVSMDDFGTGYSSLSYLRSFPFDKIKIDQSFVRGHSDDPSGMAIVHAVAALGHSLGIRTLAEGVETEEQLARIISDGCTDAQGYLIGKPLPPERIGEFLQSWGPIMFPPVAGDACTIQQNHEGPL